MPNLWILTLTTRTPAYLGLGGDGPCGHSHRVDPTGGVFVNLDVGFLLHVPRGVEQVQNLLVVQLQRSKTCTTMKQEGRTLTTQSHIAYNIYSIYIKSGSDNIKN